MNKVILIGNVTKDIELAFTPGKGTAVAKFSLAVKRDKETSDFINCTAFGKIAETIANYVTKGNKLGVIGKIQTGSYQTKDGTKRYTTDVIVNEIEFLEKKAAATGDKMKELEDTFDGVEVINSDDIPF